MLIDLTKPGEVYTQQVGGKAYNLHKLATIGLPVPPAIAVPTSLHPSIDKNAREQLQEHIRQHWVVREGTKFAVRSSGSGEDGEFSSCAGIFDSYLDVAKEDIYSAVEQVWRSLESSRSVTYTAERGITVDSMGVIIQRMIDADYAGVVFSVCPVEKDDRIALIEVVRGNGNTLVSGEKTPATVRVNKMTGMIRISRNGVDSISDYRLEQITNQLLPFVEKIEKAYAKAVDIEWAIAHDKLYILQARPITA